MLAHVLSFGRNPRGSPDFPVYPVPKACSASSPKAVQALGCSLTPGLRISFGRVTCMARAASVPGLWTLGFLLLCGVCVWVWVVFGLGFRLRPATPGWGVGVCVCFGPVPLVPRHSWLRCAAWVCVLGLGFRVRPATPGWDVGVCVCLCALCLHPATPGWGVRRGCVFLGSGFGCAPPSLAGVSGFVCADVHAPLVPRLS